MKGIQSNGFLPIIAQAIAEMEEIHGEFSSIDEINLAELGRRLLVVEGFDGLRVAQPHQRQIAEVNQQFHAPLQMGAGAEAPAGWFRSGCLRPSRWLPAWGPCGASLPRRTRHDGRSAGAS